MLSAQVRVGFVLDLKGVLSFLGVLLFELSNLLCFDKFLVLLLPLFVVNFQFGQSILHLIAILDEIVLHTILDQPVEDTGANDVVTGRNLVSQLSEHNYFTCDGLWCRGPFDLELLVTDSIK